jgi:nitrous oxidase accessory protein NosD
MKGDFTRSTFRPAKRYSRVLQQQGRVQLDADWNEEVEIERHLRETGLLDVIGHCGAPTDENGGGFRLILDGDDLAVTRGRMWVDGILCENLLPEQQTALRLVDQVAGDFPGFALPDEPGRYLFYLDVWQRHLTALEDPEIRETALGGPDTATRTQTVWQVRWVRADGAACADEVADFTADTAAPTGRMRARTRPGDEGGPCVVPEAAGYTRLENQLYRVEVHQGGELGGAGPQPTFKWSRDNGTVVTEWLATSGQEVTVGSLGRDRVLGFTDARWVELADDTHELDAVPGQLLEVSGVGDESLTLSAAPGPPGPVARHPKVRRWDMPGPGGAVAIAQAPDDDSWTPLEGGIQVDFEPGTYRSGDWWWIPARAFIGEFAGEIEWPAAGAPAWLLPEGIRHHHCRLGLADFDGQVFAELTDCRDVFCPLAELGCDRGGCCTAVVEPGGDIQAAIDGLPAAGGCVCLKVGVHEIAATLVISAPDVVLHGESPGAVVRSRGVTPLLRVTGVASRVPVERVRVADIGFELVGDLPQQAAIVVDLVRCQDVTIEDCRIGAAAFAVGAGVRLDAAHRVRVERCSVANLGIGVWVAGDSTLLTVRGCDLEGGDQNGFDAGAAGVFAEDAFGSCSIEDNRIAGFRVGVALNRQALTLDPPSSGAHASTVAGNRIERGLAPPLEGRKLFAIDVAAARCLVRDNRLSYASPAYGGIRMSGGQGRVEGNELLVQVAVEPVVAGQLPLGILLGYEADPDAGFGDGGVVRNNRLRGRLDGIWINGAEGATVEGNQLDGGDQRQAVRLGILLSGAPHAVVAANRVRDAQFGVFALGGRANRLDGNEVRDGELGMLVADERALAVTGGRCEALSGAGLLAIGTLGNTIVRGCRFGSCALTPGVAIAVAVVTDAEVVFEECEVLDAGTSLDGAATAEPAWGAFLWATRCAVRSNRITYTSPLSRNLAADNRALVLLGPLAFAAGVVSGDPTAPVRATGSALVLDNDFSGPAIDSLVNVARLQLPNRVEYRFNRVTFSNNVCQHFAPERDDLRTVSLAASRLSVVGNQVEAPRLVRSVDFNNLGRAVYVGNFTSGEVINWTQFPAPVGSFNQFG